MAGKKNLVRHLLIGRRVRWQGQLWLVTGAHRPQPRGTAFAFRLMGLTCATAGTERWTGLRPGFEAIEGDGPPALRERLALLVAMVKRCGPDVQYDDRATDSEWDEALAGAEAALAAGARLEEVACAR